MTLEVQHKLNSNIMYQKFIRENNIWYKLLNRDPELFKDFILDMKDKYKLKTTDKINKMLDNITMIQSFLDVLK